MKLQWKRLLLILAALALVAAACGSDSDDTSTGSDDDTEADGSDDDTESDGSDDDTEADGSDDDTDATEGDEGGSTEAPAEALISLDEECEAWGG
ncbi:MAG: hypothetical protein GY713_20035, partial [Actinomycetia bacterium]|nr:hypothetical protein [Actinomycetes bacterium]